MSREARVWREGELRWVQASGTGAWKTASAAATGLIGLVRAGLAAEDAWNYATVAERGTPHHHKLVGKNPVEVRFEVLFGVTADYPNPATASGVSNPQIHLELKMREEEVATASGIYFQWCNCVNLSRAFAEAEEGDTYGFTYRALTQLGPVGSGYLA